MFSSVSFPPMPPMPQIGDFQKVCEEPDWVAQHYEHALEVWRQACGDWQKACGKIAEAVKP